MDNKGMKSNRRHITNHAAIGACGLCKKDIELINMLHRDFFNLFSLCKLKEEEFNNLTECLDRMKDIILDYYMDLNKKTEEQNNG